VGGRPGAQKAGRVPEEIKFETKPAIALQQIRAAVEQGVPRAPLLADAAYGTDTQFREAMSKLGLPYVVGIMSSVSVWKPGQAPLAKPKWKGTGRPTKLLRRDRDHQPVAVKALALSLSAAAWKRITWRQGTKQNLRSRFAAVRIRPAHRDYWRGEPHPEEWLLIEWPVGETEPIKYWLSTLPANTELKDLVRLAKHRWIIERDYQELKQELGLGHFEGRGWRGFHHHATLCIAAYGFLLAERSRFSPSARAGAPKAARIGSSGLLAECRASSRFAAFAHATTNSRLTEANNTSSDVFTFRANASRRLSTVTVQSLLNWGSIASN
jgi:SRSO17 transposase